MKRLFLTGIAALFLATGTALATRAGEALKFPTVENIGNKS
jgi:hypothetical protein